MKCTLMFVLCLTSRFRREVDENSALLGYCAAYSGNFLPTSRYIPSVPSERFKYPKDSWRWDRP